MPDRFALVRLEEPHQNHRWTAKNVVAHDIVANLPHPWQSSGAGAHPRSSRLAVLDYARPGDMNLRFSICEIAGMSEEYH